MVKTSWPFVEWTELIGEKDVKRLVVREEVLIGDDVVGNMDALSKVEIFSSLFKPHALSIKGEKLEESLLKTEKKSTSTTHYLRARM